MRGGLQPRQAQQAALIRQVARLVVGMTGELAAAKDTGGASHSKWHDSMLTRTTSYRETYLAAKKNGRNIDAEGTYP